MFDKNVMGYLSLFFVVLAGVPYIYLTLTGKTKPHVFTRLIWGILAAIVSAAQYTENAGPGAWAAGLAALFTLTTAILGFWYGEKNITRSDWISFIAGLCAAPLWYFTSNPLAAVVLVTLIYAAGYYPTFRKSYTKPKEEPIFSYFVNNMKHATSILAMTEYSVTTLLFPAVLLILNAGLIVMLVWRRRSLRPMSVEKTGGRN